MLNDTLKDNIHSFSNHLSPLLSYDKHLFMTGVDTIFKDFERMKSDGMPISDDILNLTKNSLINLVEKDNSNMKFGEKKDMVNFISNIDRNDNKPKM